VRRAFRITAAVLTPLLVVSAVGFTATAQTFNEGMRAYRSGDYETAYRAFRGLAEEGDRRAQGSLGDMYRKGYGVTQDHAVAVEWYRRAADQGSAHAQDGLGLMYRDGLGVPRHAECAYIWFDLAARNFPASRGSRRDQAAGNRDRVAGSLSQQGLERARQAVGQWRPGAILDCPAPLSPRTGSGFAATEAWLPVLIIVGFLALATILALFGIRSARRQREPDTGHPSAPDPDARPLLPEVGSVIAGKAYVTDGDGLRVSGYRIRFAGLDAPEHNQWAKHQDGYWIRHGERVKSALIRAIGGSHVRIVVEEYDQYDRVIGTVTCDDQDVGEWLVRNGHAVAAYDNRYEEVETEARREQRGMWSHMVNWHPQDWRRRTSDRS
jgi:endonuclease YncB( thermonuclease family)